MTPIRQRFTALAAALMLLCPPAHGASTIVLIEGLGGNERYEQEFSAQIEAIAEVVVSLAPVPAVMTFRAGATRDTILEYFATLEETMSADDQLTVYLIGHGSYDDHEYKFNIAGPDLTDADILEALQGAPTERQVLINTSSASGAGTELWQDDERIVVTATRSGAERHATRFGMRFIAALGNESADLDKNNIITVQEAFDFADRAVRDFFEAEGRLATEHAVLTGSAERAGRISLARLGATRTTIADTELSRLNEQRDEINGSIERLRSSRGTIDDAQYQDRLLSIMLELAEVEEAIERREAELADE
ncbi:MAG: hypothetical protein AAF417_02715 [Pseudomonadota bacterium]